MLIVSDLINNGIEIIESLKKRNKDFSKEIHLIIISSAKTQDGPPAPGWKSGHSFIFIPFTRTYFDLILFNSTLYSKMS